MAADLDTLITADIPEGRQNLLDSFANLERVAEYCENNYYQCENKRAALEETKSYTTQSLASVAYQINTLAYNFLQALDLQAAQLGEMESQVNHITQTVGIHKEKVARREIGVLTTNKSVTRQYKIIAPATPERPVKYVRKPIDYAALDTIGHGVRVAPQKQHLHIQQQPLQQPQQPGLQKRPSTAGGYGTGMMAAGGAGSAYGSIGNVSTNSAGPAPTTKPPTPPQQARYSSGTLNRSKEYRTPPVVAPPQVPSNYAPNYPMMQQQVQYQKGMGKQYGTLPHPQVQMVHPVQQPNELPGGATMPRLSSASMRSTSSHSSTENQMNRPSALAQQQLYATRQSSATPPGSIGSRQSTPPSQYGVMVRPSQRPPSPPLPPPPTSQAPLPSQHQQQQQLMQQKYMMQQQQLLQQQQQLQLQQKQQQIQQQMQQQNQNPIYGRQSSEPRGAGGPPMESLYQRQMSTGAAQPGPAPPQASQYMTRQQVQQSMMNRKPSVDKGLPAWVPKNYIDRVTAIYDYSADKDDELTFNEGSTIFVLKKNDDGWWEGVMDGVTGLFPGNYVEATI